ncbi:MAG: Asp-tRNA(Asn)/Glu-tRNA(Gln) amidotransferase subunit GatB [Planctomycetaceae bacterium]
MTAFTSPPTTIIGLEVHVQLLTETKIFCGCLNRFNPEEPNVQTCPVCLGLPGALPVLNRRALELAIRAGLALSGTIAGTTKWDRKQYYYPDLPKAYQISQFDLPFCDGGWMDVDDADDGGETRTSRIRLIRVHLEEDAGKNLHDENQQGRDSRIDLNRAGTPLLEIVSEPDLRSAAQSRRYLEEMRLLMAYLGVSDCNMQEGSLRCDANVNLELVNDDGVAVRTPIVEIKNLNSFRGVEAALEYEIGRQRQEFTECGGVYADSEKQTRGWDADRGVTFAQRGKEDAADYRYFPDPDLVPVQIGEAWIEELRAGLCEPPAARRRRLIDDLELSDYDASVIIDQGRDLADYFEVVADKCGDPKQAANWVTQDVLRELNERGLAIGDFAIDAEGLTVLLARIASGDLTTGSAREVFIALLDATSEDQAGTIETRIDQIISDRGLAAVADSGELDALLDAVIERNPQAAADFRGGKQAAIGKLIGEVMREAKGANPQSVRGGLIERLSS